MSAPRPSPFPRLTAALDAADHPMDFWWRDDDAVADTPALRRLLDLAAHAAAPLTLAVIPAGVEALAAYPPGGPRGVIVAQHGDAHAALGANGRQRELSDDTDPAWLDARLVAGAQRLDTVFGNRVQPVMVPPWNRADPGVLARLPALGFHAVSGLTTDRPTGPLPAINVDIDVMDWALHTSRGPDAIDAQAAAAVATRLADPGAGPIGVMTHHLVHDDAVWADLTALIDTLNAHPAARWIGLDAALASVGLAPADDPDRLTQAVPA